MPTKATCMVETMVKNSEKSNMFHFHYHYYTIFRPSDILPHRVVNSECTISY